MRFARSFFTAAALLLGAPGCSPLYVLQAGWEEAGILLRRQDIPSLIADPATDAELRSMLELVLSVREFALKNNLDAGGSFTQYSEIDRDVLVWVLSASPKTSLSFQTWWFPIVGRVPYKGYFNKEDGIAAARRLQEEGNDIFLRPSPAFSTLGWFDDPLMSTMRVFDEVGLANTVLHEIFHNTIWIPGNAPFNETMANAFGSVGAIYYFEETAGVGSELARTARNRWHDELLYARFIDDLADRLRHFYSQAAENEMPRKEILKQREAVFEEARKRWQEGSTSLQTEYYKQIFSNWNNAVVLAQSIYLDRLWLFAELLERCERSLLCFVEEAEQIKVLVKEEKLTAFEALERRLDIEPPEKRDA